MSLARDTKNALITQYKEDDRPWVIGYSGGKDSTLLLQLVYEALFTADFKLHKPVYIMASDTRVEAPNIEEYLLHSLKKIEKHAKYKGLPIYICKVAPRPENSFWGNLIGKGYPPPTDWFRWCTSNMKIKPMRDEIEKITNIYGSVILLLGTRMDESARRASRMKSRELNSRGLNPHHKIPNTLVFTPIAEWFTDDVWDYLYTHNPPPWGESHDHMFNLYVGASGGECPVIMDLNTPSCGGSRFGCWTCTVIKETKSIQGFIDAGETWMQPLQIFRDYLKKVREEPSWRMPFRRDGSSGPGAFLPNKRQLLLHKLLQVEREVGKRLISDEEISYIQSIWSKEFDLTQQAAFKIAISYGREDIPMIEFSLASVDKKVCDDLILKYEINLDLIDNLLKLVLHDYPDLQAWGAQANLKRDIASLIKASVGYDANRELE